MLQELICCCAVLLACPQDEEKTALRPEEMVFVEMKTSRATYFEQEPVHLSLRVGFDQQRFETNAIQLFGRKLRVPLQLQVPWIDGLEGTVSLVENAAAAREETHDQAAAAKRHRATIALNDEVIEASWVEDRLVGGRTFRVLEIKRSYLPVRPGDLIIPAPLVRFAYATRFEESFISGRIPIDRREGRVTGQALALHIEAIPEEGRPPGFTGAVGRFTVHAEARPTTLQVGQTVRLDLRIEGTGNIDRFDAPVLDQLPGLHLAGRVERKSPSRRIISYDLVPTDQGVLAIPAVRLVFFDPSEPAHYEIVETESIPITLRPAGADSGFQSLLAEEAGRTIAGVNDIFAPAPVTHGATGKRGARPDLPLLVCALVSPWILAAGLALRLRRIERRRRDPAGVRARAAAAEFREQMARRDADVAAALTGYLAARLRVAAPAVITPDLREHLVAAGISGEPAGRTAALLERLVAARCGASGPLPGADEVTTLVRALEEVFKAREAEA